MRERDPHLLPLFLSAVLAALFGVLAIAQTDSWWVAGAAVGALILLVLATVIDVTGGTPSHAFERVLVVTSEPLRARQVLDAVAQQTGSTTSAAGLGVMVVSPEGFGRPELTNDEDYYEVARRAEGETVASLRQASVKATGHVGDHDAAQAVADALVLFPSDRVLVFAHLRDAAAYRIAFNSDVAGRPVSIVDVGPVRRVPIA
jgi:hypothetical protein